MIAIRKRTVDGFVSLIALQSVAFLYCTLHCIYDHPFVCVMVNPWDINLPYIIPAACFIKYAGNLDHYYDDWKAKP